MKVLPKDFVADANRLRRFEQEAKTLATLNHPNILTIYGAGLHEGAPYVASELPEGKTLRDEMNGGALPVRKAVARFYGRAMKATGINFFLPTVNKGELAVIYCWFFLCLSAQGPGAFALDNILGLRRSP